MCSIALVPENMEVDGLSWHGYLQTNKRSGRIRRVRRIYNVAGRIGLLDDGTLEVCTAASLTPRLAPAERDEISEIGLRMMSKLGS